MIGEALALRAINAGQYTQLDKLLSIVSAQKARRAPVTSNGPATARRATGTSKSGATKRKNRE